MELIKIRKELSKGIPLTNIDLKVTFYSRVSTDHVEQKKSLKNQSDYFYEYINSVVNWTYVSGYIDEGITGTSDIKRENFMRMIVDAKNGFFDLIITKEISRFSRNTLDSIKYTRELLEYGVAVLFLNDNINTLFSDSELRLTIMASMAQDEIRRLSERVKFGMQRSIKNGVILGNNLLYGYKKNSSGNLEIVKEEAKIIRLIYRSYLSLNNLNYIKNLLNNKKSNNKNWNSTSIKRILLNPKYKGYYCAHKSEIIDYMSKKIYYYNYNDWIMYPDKKRIPPIVSEDIWNSVNEKINKNHSTRITNKYSLSGKIFCKNDKKVFFRRKVRRIIDDATWMCSNYLNNGKKCCNNPNIRESELDKILRYVLFKINFDYNKVLLILNRCYNKEIKMTDIDKKNIYDKLISIIINKIEVSKLNDYIVLDIYLNINKYELENIFEFKRGYDTNNTKKYIIKYKVNYFFVN